LNSFGRNDSILHILFLSLDGLPNLTGVLSRIWREVYGENENNRGLRGFNGWVLGWRLTHTRCNRAPNSARPRHGEQASVAPYHSF
jgi:hypothetical protein